MKSLFRLRGCTVWPGRFLSAYAVKILPFSWNDPSEFFLHKCTFVTSSHIFVKLSLYYIVHVIQFINILYLVPSSHWSRVKRKTGLSKNITMPHPIPLHQFENPHSSCHCLSCSPNKTEVCVCWGVGGGGWGGGRSCQNLINTKMIRASLYLLISAKSPSVVICLY